jgi:hypothetical protein
LVSKLSIWAEMLSSGLTTYSFGFLISHSIYLTFFFNQ